LNHTRQTAPRVFAATLLCLCTVAATAADHSKVLDLVVASNVDAPLVGTFKDAVRARLKGLDAEQRKCWLDLPADTFQPAAVDYLASQLTDAEVVEGLAFFATPVGKRMARVYDGESSQARAVELSNLEMRQHDAFLATRPGSELLIPNNLLRSREVKKQFDGLFAKKWKHCGGPPD
jgi:hypothetical protein